MARYDEEQDFDEKRLKRSQRRKRSQMVAYSILVAIIVLLVALIAGGVCLISGAGKNKGGSAEDGAGQESLEASEEEQAPVIETPEEESQEEAYTEEAMLDDIVNSVISEMTLEDKVSSLFITTPEQLTGVDTAVKAGTGTQEALSNYAVGGIVYAPKNIKSTEQISEMLEATQSYSKYPLFTIIPYQSISSEAVRENLGIADADGLDNAEQTKEAATSIGSAYFNLGFNFAMAPSTDLSENGFYSADAELAKERTLAFAQGLSESGIATCAHVFPLTNEDAAVGLATSDISRDDLVLGEYEVFKNLIDNEEIKAIMVTDTSIPSITGDNTPCMFSADVIQNELRGALGFEGIVITSPLSDGAITEYYTQAEAAVTAIKSGADMLYLPEDFTEAYDSLLSAVQSGTISETRIDESLRRIFAVKYADRVDQISQEN